MHQVMGGFHPQRILASLALVAALGACGGGGSSDEPAAPGVARISAAGGIVTASDGASVEVPAGAFAIDATVSITRDGTGTPALPGVATPASAIYKITPHGGDFRRYVTVSIPVTASDVPDGAQLVMITADPGETTWRVLSAATYADGVMRAPVMQFSYFQIASLAAVRMPRLQTHLNRLTNASFPGAQQVPSGHEISGDYPVVTTLSTSNLFGLEAESRLSWQPTYAASAGAAAPRVSAGPGCARGHRGRCRPPISACGSRRTLSVPMRGLEPSRKPWPFPTRFRSSRASSPT
jgi:hypothetical protein